MHVTDTFPRVFYLMPMLFFPVDITIPILWMEKGNLGEVTYLVEI